MKNLVIKNLKLEEISNLKNILENYRCITFDGFVFEDTFELKSYFGSKINVKLKFKNMDNKNIFRTLDLLNSIDIRYSKIDFGNCYLDQLQLKNFRDFESSVYQGYFNTKIKNYDLVFAGCLLIEGKIVEREIPEGFVNILQNYCLPITKEKYFTESNSLFENKI